VWCGGATSAMAPTLRDQYGEHSPSSYRLRASTRRRRIDVWWPMGWSAWPARWVTPSNAPPGNFRRLSPLSDGAKQATPPAQRLIFMKIARFQIRHCLFHAAAALRTGGLALMGTCSQAWCAAGDHRRNGWAAGGGRVFRGALRLVILRDERRARDSTRTTRTGHGANEAHKTTAARRDSGFLPG